MGNDQSKTVNQLAKHNPYASNHQESDVDLVKKDKHSLKASPHSTNSAQLHLGQTDIKFLVNETKLPEDEVMKIVKSFNSESTNGELNRAQFRRLYSELKKNDPNHYNLDAVSDHVFDCFDKSKNGEYL